MEVRVKRQILGLLLAACCLVGGALPVGAEDQGFTKRTMFFFDTFDTMITIIGYTQDQAAFDRVTAQARERFTELHRLFDAYHEYGGVQNIYTLNRDAKKAPVKVAPELMNMLLFARDWQPRLGDTVNIAMGGPLNLWHEYRTKGMADEASAELPPMEQLLAAAGHADMDSLVLNEEEGTVFFADADVRLDVGAIAKGYATELVAQMMLASEMPHFIINAGGNVRVGLPPMDGRANWAVSVQDPDTALGLGTGDGIAEVFYLSGLSVVTSGDYERFYTVNGARYHHIISPKTLMPATENRAVTIVCQDGALADILSTAVFILPYEEGRALVESLAGVEALWIRPDGQILMTEGLKKISRSGGAGGE
jgi:thiamine biosynthesis lipoprotein